MNGFVNYGLTRQSASYHYGETQHADHYVYRCYDADDVLLYIGCTVEVSRRMNAHQHAYGKARASQWLAACMVRHEVTGPFKGRDAGRAAERAAIEAEQPIFNTQERRKHSASLSHGIAGAYLVDRGHLALALETACTCWEDHRELGGCAPWCAPHVAEGRLPVLHGQAFEDALSAFEAAGGEL